MPLDSKKPNWMIIIGGLRKDVKIFRFPTRFQLCGIGRE